MSFRILRKLFSFIALFSMFVQLLAPYTYILPSAAFAQEVTPSPIESVQSEDPALTDTPTPIPTEIPTPTDTVTPTPIPTEANEPTHTLTEIPTPTDTVTPTPTPTQVESGQAESQTTQDQDNQTNNNSSQGTTPNVEVVSQDPVTISTEGLTTDLASSPQAATKTAKTGKENISFVVLENISAPSVNLEAANTQSSASLTTDKLDYAPTDTAMITGTGLLPKTTYILYVNSADPPAVNFSTEVISSDQGSFVYAYQLDGIYRPNYKVELKDQSGQTVASTTFTDSAVQTISNAACMQNNPGSPSSLVCTANDVSIASVNNIQILDDGCKFPGDTVTFTATWDIQSNASERYDVGLYFATAGQSSALNGATSCSVSTLANSPTPPWSDLDNDACGDITSASQVHPVITMTAVCNPDPTTNLLKMPYCTSWDNNSGGVCSTPSNAFPSTKSKCNCQDGFTVPIQVPPSSIEVVKSLTPSSDAGLFNLQINSTTATGAANIGNGGTTGKVGVTAGSNTIGETAGSSTSLADYSKSVSCVLRGTQTSVATTGTNPWTLSVSSGQDILCTITNTKQSGTITVNKTVVPSTDSGLFNLGIDGVTAGAGANVGNNGTTGAVPVNTTSQHTVSETAGTNTSLSDYTTTYSCNNNLSGSGTSVPAFSVTANQNVVCTFTNTLKQTHLTLVKTVTNDNGGTALATAWTLSANGSTPISGTTGNSAVTNALVTAGTYTLSENGGPSGYTAGDWSCVRNTQSPVTGNSITLAPGDNATCTINNNDIQPKLTVTKVVVNNNGGTKVVSDFPLFVNAAGVTSGVQNGFNAGTYTVSETPQTGYTGVISGDCASNGSITLAAGDVKACTITNNDNAPQLHLRKTITNDNGGSASTTDWMLTATGTGGSPTNLSGTTPVDSGSDFKADTYALAEINGPSEYTAGAWDCGQATMTDATHVVVPLGGNVTCIINNNDNTPKLTLNKIVVNNNGGTASESDWTLTATGSTSISGLGAAGSTDVVSGASFDAGTYVLSESAGPAGYTASSWTCSNGDNDGTISVALDDDITCSITNDDNAPTLTLVKAVTNDNGGTSSESAWILTATGPTGFSGAGPTVNNGASFDAGTYDLSESGAGGYSASDWVCQGGDQTDGDTVVVGLGQDVICTVTNNDQPATLIVKKIVINDNGGTLEADDFSFAVNSGQAQSFEADGQNDLTVNAGTYNVTEPSVAGYSTTYDNCSDINIPNGRTATCTITNNDISPQLTVIKNVVNNNGGTAVASNFTMLVTGTNVSNAAFGGSESGTTVTLDAGSYSVGEIAVTGYSSSFSADCSATIAVGDNKTCTVTNNDEPGTLIVRKVVVNDNGGTLEADDFSFVVNDGSAVSFEADGENELILNVGSYLITEPSVLGYETTYDNCDDVSISNGGREICTITNNDQAGHLIVHKITNPVDTTTEFSVTASGGAIVSPAATQTIVGGGTVDYTVNAGTYNVIEAAESGWDETGNTCVNVVVENGQTEECTITNTKRAQITIVKDVVGNPDPTDFTFNNNFGNGNPSTFLLDEDNNGTLPSSRTFEVLPGTYIVSEDAVVNWQSPESTSCTNGETIESIDVAPGESVTCTFVNEELAKIILIKNTIGGDGTFDFDATGTGLPADIDLTTVSGTATQTFTGLDQDSSYSISENVPAGWVLSSATCDKGETVEDIDIEPGETVTCTFTNTKLGNITVVKYNDHNSNGVKDSGDETLGDTGVGAQVEATRWEINLVGENVNSSQWTGAQAQGQVTFSDLLPNSFTLSEQIKDGWSQTNIACGNEEGIDKDNSHAFNLAAGQNLTCYIGNQGRGTITVNKNVDTNNDGQVDIVGSTDWLFELATADYAMGTTVPVAAGSYVLGEFQNKNYHFVSLYCDDINQNGSTTTVNVGPGDDVVCTYTNARDTGTLIVHKEVDTNGDNSYDVNDDADSNELGFRWGFESTPSNNLSEFGGSGEVLTTDIYGIYENEVSNYHFTGWYDNSEGGSCEESDNTALPARVSVNSDQTTEITLCNQRDTGTITVNKVINNISEQDPGLFNLQVNGDTEAANQGNGGTTGAVTVITGSHSVGEVEGTDTDLSNYVSSISCVNDGGEGEEIASTDGNGTSLSGIQVNKDDDIVCTITNTKKGRVIVTKYNDFDGDGELDEGDVVLSGWTINLGEDSKVTNANGIADFSNIVPGSYSLSEDLKDGWEQTKISCDNNRTRRSILTDNEDGGTTVRVSPGQTVNCSILNHSLTPIIKIEKTNNSLGIDRIPGDNVLYTLNVTLEQSDANNVTVTDLLPNGFKYRAGSWTAKLNGTPISIPQPVYSSPGVWQVGSMQAGDVIELSYIADIDGAQHPGLYKDVAWAKGVSLASETVLAAAQTIGFVDTNFVGTQVNVVKNLQNSVAISVTEKEGEVLGASTELPATGANNIWVILASLILGFGLSLMTVGYIMRKRYV